MNFVVKILKDIIIIIQNSRAVALRLRYLLNHCCVHVLGNFDIFLNVATAITPARF